MSSQTILNINNISLSFGGVQALKDISVEVKDNEILA
jgi:ABC-type branched-subunit amino acid transport system ATPase component